VRTEGADGEVKCRVETVVLDNSVMTNQAVGFEDYVPLDSKIESLIYFRGDNLRTR